MKNLCVWLLLAMVIFSPLFLSAQMQVTVVSRCGGMDTVIIPNIVDRDSDGMDDALEQMLLNRFMPPVIGFNNENCPGPALDGTGDTNLIVARIYAYPEQYTTSNNVSGVQTHPLAVVGQKQLYAGLIWWNPTIMVHCAVLYGQDCGALGHTADVEGFHFSLRYIGPDTLAGWMYDTVMANWQGAVIQTVSHDGTACQQIETYPYKSSTNPTGKDSVYASPDKHGNYLTIGGCGSSFICNPGCGGTQIRKTTVNVNVGELGAPLVSDLGTYYPAYAGQNPWSNTNFLNGGAGTIEAKMDRPITSDFLQGGALQASQICPLYVQCFGVPGNAYSDYTCYGSTYIFYGQNLTQPGVYSHTLADVHGCDSVTTLTLTVFQEDTTSTFATICNGSSYSFYGQLLSAAGVYTSHLSGVHGCDSSITLNLAVNPTSAYSFSASICGGSTYDFNGVQYNAPGVYNDTLSNSAGCDSIVTLTLNTTPESASSISASICNGDSYNFNGQQLSVAGAYNDTLQNSTGCDSVVTLTLQVNSPSILTYYESICRGSSVNFNGQEYSSTGLYSDTLQSSTGCDSIISLALQVDSLPPVSWNGNTDTVLRSGDSILLAGGMPAGGVYAGAGVLGKVFYADSAGAGLHIISYTFTDSSGCSDSAIKTIEVIVSGIDEYNADNTIWLYPNPASDILIIQSDLISQAGSLFTICDLTGRNMAVPYTRQSDRVVFNTNHLAAGWYCVKLTTENLTVTKKFVKQGY